MLLIKKIKAILFNEEKSKLEKIEDIEILRFLSSIQKLK